MNWTEQEIILLKSLNNKLFEKQELISLFNGRSYLSLKKKSKKIGINIKIYRLKQWKENEIEILRLGKYNEIKKIITK